MAELLVQNDNCCEVFGRALYDGIIHYDPAIRSYYITVREDEETRVRQEIWFCPWCASKLPKSLRNEWFDALEKMGIDPMEDEIPAEYRDETWWKDNVQP